LRISSDPEELLGQNRREARGFVPADRDVAIEVSGVSKVYHTGNLFPGFSDYLRSPTKNPLAFLRDFKKNSAFHALKDVDFTVRRGEVVGLIGQNGSGKSTTLKLLSRITAPTSGRLTCAGRVSALIEVGAGFNVELTGRENVYLNGAILGISTRELREKFDEIVTFAELEKFIDTPVKWYSSGMHVRLGFSVAVALDPEILLVDEVLAVGDSAFRAKSMEKMLSFVDRRNVTILFVSHHMRAIQSICDRVIWLHKGVIQRDGPTDEVIEAYNEFLSRGGPGEKLEGIETSGEIDITAIKLLDAHDRERTEFKFGEPLRIRVHYRAKSRIERPYVTVAIYNKNGHLYLASHMLDEQNPEALEGEGFIEVEFESLRLMPGRYQPVGVIHQKDGYSHLVHNFYMPSFAIGSSPEDLGWPSKFAHVMINNANCAVAPYRWRYGGGDAK
jgi:ABC-type polysaccharide/polyol phosphate transport system ATPase subunit